jgi:hypothetical protein
MLRNKDEENWFPLNINGPRPVQRMWNELRANPSTYVEGRQTKKFYDNIYQCVPFVKTYFLVQP